MTRQSSTLAPLTALLVAAACLPDSAAVEGSASRAPVRTGAQVLIEDSLHLIDGRRVGLITNHTGLVGSVGAEIESTADLLHRTPGVELVALFAPEHGIRGAAEAGVRIDDTVDEATGVPVHSLYGGTREPSSATLRGVEVLLFDIQDIGARYYTYVWTMSLAMEAAGGAGIPFVVLDRPNPIGGEVQGNVLDPDFASFVGRFPVPMRHGMTPGELARLLVGEFGVEVDLTVVPLDGWTRDLSWPGTQLPWVAPSPNMPSIVSALHYPGTCLFEGTPLSVGRGTPLPFQQIGAPWLDTDALLEALGAYDLPDLRFESVTFTPRTPGDGKFDGEVVKGVRFVATGPAYDPTRAALAVLIEARRQAGDRWAWRSDHFDRLAGTDRLRSGIDRGESLAALTAGWPGEIAAFEALRMPYLLYGDGGGR
ncbi:MAG: DUF1343 domain-containing protein [Longimicrobiales bacterium]|nr:DUF1343 domain-containing protein [Longimicrobiales bacterium]